VHHAAGHSLRLSSSTPRAAAKWPTLHSSMIPMNVARPLLCLLATCAGATSTRADVLTLAQGTNLDISALNIGACGDLAFQANSNSLWVADGLVNGDLHAINPTTGALITSRDTAAIPGLDQGPDALAVDSPTLGSNLFLFSPIGEDEGGRLNSLGALIADYGTSRAATGADFDNSGQLWIVSGTTPGAGVQLLRLAVADGSVLQTVPINPAITSRMVDVTFDPHTGACYVLAETTNTLLEISLTTGNVLSTTDLTPFLILTGRILGGVDFDATGARLFVSTGAGIGADTVVVLDRAFGANVCSNGPGEIPCPCGNIGLAGRGCNNSFATGGGLLRTNEVPRVSADSLTLNVLGLPPTTTCLFFQGTNNPAEIFSFGDGSRCVIGSVIRLGTKPTSAGTSQYPSGIDQLIHLRGAIPVGGATRFYQAWYRNVAAFCTPDGFNPTNAVKVFWAP